MNRYSTLFIVPEREPHQQMYFTIIPSTLLFHGDILSKGSYQQGRKIIKLLYMTFFFMPMDIRFLISVVIQIN